MVKVIIDPNLVPFASIQFSLRIDYQFSCGTSVEREVECQFVFCENEQSQVLNCLLLYDDNAVVFFL